MKGIKKRVEQTALLIHKKPYKELSEFNKRQVRYLVSTEMEVAAEMKRRKKKKDEKKHM